MADFFTQVLHNNAPPDVWYSSIMSLIPKNTVPAACKELRPICLTSHLSKTYARLLMTRIEHDLEPKSAYQCCGKSRQSADYIWTILRAVQISYEWNVPICVVKLDLEKAFDRLDRGALGERMVEKLGPAHPAEIGALLSLLREGSAIIPTVWGDENIRMDSGVRQGGVEPPTLFAWLVSELLEELDSEFPSSSWAPDAPIDKEAYMDDVLMWDGKVSALQARITALQRKLSRYGLRINIQKSSLLCHGDTGGREVILEGNILESVEEGDSLSVMGFPVRPGVSDGELMASLVAKARKKFYALADVLQSHSPILKRMWLLDRLVFTTMSWSVGVIHPSQTAINLLNEFHTECIGLMAKFHRRADELYYHFKQRSVREARCLIVASEKERWGTRFIRMHWSYTGHRARCLYSRSPASAGLMSGMRSFAWWRGQQSSICGSRHGRRHFPRLSNGGPNQSICWWLVPCMLGN